MSLLEKYHDLVKEAIAQHKVEERPKELYEPINYMLNLGGKRLRPIMALMACDMFGGDLQKALNPSLAVEYFHNFSLMHDDIMDEAPLRRGKDTVHVKYGLNTAILSGDALMIKSYQMFENLNSRLYKDCVKLFTHTAIQLCEGQQYDMNYADLKEVSLREYIKMITGKTAVLCGCALKLGALIAQAGAKEAKNIYEFGVNLGIAFQLRDDYLDLFGNSELTGKLMGGDVFENKKTILYILARQKADEKQTTELQFWYKSYTDDIEKVHRVKEIFEELKVKDSCMDLIQAYTEEAREYLDKIQVPEENKKPLYELISLLVSRES